MKTKLLSFTWILLLSLAAAGQKISDLTELTGAAAATDDIVPIVDISAGTSGSKKITLAELFSTPVPWEGVVITGEFGGTGVANTGKTITLGGNLTTSGAHSTTLTTTGNTAVTLPTTGTLATTAQVDLKADSTDLAWIDVTRPPYNAIPDDGLDDSAAITAALTAAASSTRTRTVYLPPGSFNANLIVPGGVNLVGCGTALDGNDPAAQIVTELVPNSDASPVITLLTADSSHLRGFHIAGSGTTVCGIQIGTKPADSQVFAGISVKVSDVRINECVIGVQANFVVGLIFEHVHCNFGGIGFQFNNKVDTSRLVSCGASFNTGTAVDANHVRNLAIHGGEWGNGDGMWLDGRGSLSNISVYDANVESVDSDYLIAADYSRMLFSNVRIDVGVANPDQVSFVRQFEGNADITIINPVWLGGSPGYLWEGVAGMRAPVVIGPSSDVGVFRFSPDNTFATTTRSCTVAQWRGMGVRAFRTALQTGLTTGTNTAITFATESYDHAAIFDPATGLMTAPEAGYYTMSIRLMLNTANAAGYSRIVERINGTYGTILANRQNAPQFDGLNASITRYLTAGQTWGVGFGHNLGSDMAIYATGAGTECVIDFQKDN